MNKSILEVVHETARDLREAGLMGDEEMRKFDVLCKPPLDVYTPTRIKKIREKTRTSQDTFAACLNISKTTVRRWERGQTKPHGASLRLLNIMDQKGLEALG